MTDYTKYPLGYKIRKIARYTRLYGFKRTLMKVRSQLHVKQAGSSLSADWRNAESDPDERVVGIIGCGNFSFSTLSYYANSYLPNCVRAVYDIDGARAISLAKEYGAIYAAADPDKLIHDDDVRIIFIASNHASHAEYAIPAILAGKRVHIEKPHVVNHDQLARLVEAIRTSGNNEVYLGFNRPRSIHFRKIHEWISKEDGPVMINWFIAGHAIPDGHWYFSEKEGGRVLGNLCHWTDLSLRMVGMEKAFPVVVIPGSRKDSKSDFALSFQFADESLASITFSAKGHTFDGVREYLNVHRGDALISMKDFHVTELNRGAEHHKFSTLFRSHGHDLNVRNTIFGESAESLEYIEMTARLYLAAKEAIDSGKAVQVEMRDTK